MARKKYEKMYSAHIEGKCVVAKSCLRTLKNKVYKYMTSISKNVYIDKLNIVNEYSNAYQKIIKMKSIDVKNNIYIYIYIYIYILIKNLMI